jgi:hypothetical protein
MSFATRARIEDANIATRTECLSAARAVGDIRVYVCGHGASNLHPNLTRSRPMPRQRSRVAFPFNSIR